MSAGINVAPSNARRDHSFDSDGNPVWMFRIAVGLLALILGSTLIVTTSRSALSTTTDRPCNSVTAGDVVLVDDDLATSRFTVADVQPGDTVTACIQNESVTALTLMWDVES